MLRIKETVMWWRTLGGYFKFNVTSSENLSEEVTLNLRAKLGRADLGISGEAAWEWELLGANVLSKQ